MEASGFVSVWHILLNKCIHVVGGMRLVCQLHVRGITVSLPESLWLPPQVQKLFDKGQIAWLLLVV